MHTFTHWKIFFLHQGSGKRTLVNQFCFGKRLCTPTTLKLEFYFKEIHLNQRHCYLQGNIVVDCFVQDSVLLIWWLGSVWNIYGQDRYGSIHRRFCPGGQGALLLYDITSQLSFDRVKHWSEELKRHSEPKRPALVLLGTPASEHLLGSGSCATFWSDCVVNKLVQRRILVIAE